jgi:hypothetical protein
MTEPLMCWKCGGALAELPLPLARLADCPACHAELHVCRQCRFYDPRVEGRCREERAEEVREKERANFCDWFKPRADAYCPPDAARAAAARAGADALFGGGPAPAAEPDPARAALDALFGAKSPKKP